MTNNKSQKSKVIKATMFGSFAGAAMGLLLAPKSGQEMRQDLTEQFHKLGDKAEDIRDKAQSAWQNVEDKTHAKVETGKNYIQKGKRYFNNFKTLVYEIRQGALTKTD